MIFCCCFENNQSKNNSNMKMGSVCHFEHLFIFLWTKHQNLHKDLLMLNVRFLG